MMLELGMIPVRFVLMKKRFKLLNYILNEATETMIRQVFETLKKDSPIGDFVSLVEKDKVQLELFISDENVQIGSKWSWDQFVNEKVCSIEISGL